jgi:hypothetical protein
VSRIKSVIGLASRALAVMIVIGLAATPEAVVQKLDGALSASWRALGDRLANHELNAIARQLDRERQDAERIEALRDGLAADLRSLGVRRECVASRVSDEARPRGDHPERELAHLDAAIALIRSAVARTDRVLDEAHRDLSERDCELIALRAAADVSRIDRALARPVGDPSLWSVRVARVRDVLRTTLPESAERGSHLRVSGLP